MKELTPEQLQDNWKEFIQLLEDTFEGDRLSRLLKMYDHFEERMMFAPASGKEHYHNCHAGGYVEHVLHVTKCAKQLHKLWSDNGATINFTEEELVFAAVHHDLGKLGDLAEDYYVPQDNDWWIKNRGEYYKHNPKLQFMTVTDRALFLLQHYGVQMTENEYLGLKLTDGLYEEANKSYYIGYTPERSLRTNIAYILHQADMMATHIEYDQWKRGDHLKKVVKQEEVKVKTQQSDAANKAFKELFGE